MQRQKKVAELKKSGTGTPITEATFKQWQERKRKVKAEAAKKLVEAEMRKKKGGKGLAVLTGRDLYTYKKSLFEDKDKTDTGEENKGGDSQTITANDEDTQQQNGGVAEVAAKLESDLFLEGDDDDLDDLEDD